MTTTLLTISGSLILLLLAINGYFIKRFVATVDHIKELITELRLLVEIQRTKTEGYEARLNDHSTRIKTLEQHAFHQDR